MLQYVNIALELNTRLTNYNVCFKTSSIAIFSIQNEYDWQVKSESL